MTTVERIRSSDTHDLRRRVLRGGDPTADVDWPEDASDTTFHLGGFDDSGTLVAISTWIPTGSTVQLRGMATDPAFAGTGIATLLLQAGLDACRAVGADTVWANARTTALGFYEQAGFRAEGDVFETSATGLPHRRITLALR